MYNVLQLLAKNGFNWRIQEKAIGQNTVVVAVGGVWTIHEVIIGFISYSNVVIGMIPCGSGNDFARDFYVPTEPLLALKYTFCQSFCGGFVGILNLTVVNQ